MGVVENINSPQIKVKKPSPNVFNIRVGDQEFTIVEKQDGTVLHGSLTLPEKSMYVRINGKKINPSPRKVEIDYVVDFDTDRLLYAKVQDFYFVDLLDFFEDIFDSYYDTHVENIEEHEDAINEIAEMVEVDYIYVSPYINEHVDFFKDTVGATIEEVDIHRAHADDSLLDIDENINQNKNFVVRPTHDENKLKVSFSKDSYPLGGEEFEVVKQGENTIVQGTVSSIYYARYPSYGRISYTSHDLNVEIRMDYELNLRFPETSIEVKPEETWDSVFEFSQELMVRFEDTPDPDSPEFEDFESEIMADIGFNYGVVKADALEQVKLFTEIVGSDFEEIDLHRTTPSDSLLDIAEHRNNMRTLMNIFEDSKDFRVFINDDGILQIEFHNKPPVLNLLVHQTNTDSFILEGTTSGQYIYYDGDYSNYYKNAGYVSLDFIVTENENINIIHRPTPSHTEHNALCDITFEISDNLGDAPDHEEDPEGYDKYIGRLFYEVKNNTVINQERAKKDVMKVLDYVKKHIGTTYDEIYRHVSAPPDRLLDIE